MNLSHKKVIVISFLFIILLFQEAIAWVYIYEVTTATRRFQTASKLQPDTFLYYNGGYDIIHDLKIIAIYPNDKMAQALKDYNLEENNSNDLIFNPVAPNIPQKPYYWWR